MSRKKCGESLCAFQCVAPCLGGLFHSEGTQREAAQNRRMDCDRNSCARRLDKQNRGELVRVDLKSRAFADFLGGISASEVDFSTARKAPTIDNRTLRMYYLVNEKNRSTVSCEKNLGCNLREYEILRRLRLLTMTGQDRICDEIEVFFTPPFSAPRGVRSSAALRGAHNRIIP